MSEQQNWRELIESYLQAYCDHDWMRRQERAAMDWESSFLAANGTPAMQQRHAVAMQQDANRQTKPVEREAIRLVDETTQRVTVEIFRLSGQRPLELIPHFTTRFVLKKSDPAWLIEAMYHPCVSCNSSYGDDSSKLLNTPGKCFLCQLRVTKGDETQGYCPDCDGTRICKYCANEEIAGWRRITSLC